MSWTDGEFAEIRTLAGARFPSSIPASAASTWDEWRRSLERYAYADVMAAIIEASEAGPFPTLADLIDRVRQAKAARVALLRIAAADDPAHAPVGTRGCGISLDDTNASDSERDWNDRVRRRYLTAYDTVARHEEGGIPLDPGAYRGDADAIHAAQLRRHYDRQIAAGVPVTGMTTAPVPRPTGEVVIGEHEARALDFLDAHPEEPVGIVALTLVESYCAALVGKRAS